MAFTQEVQDWLNELELSPEELQQISPVLEKRQEKVKGMALRQADYSRKTQALAKQKSDLESEIETRRQQVERDAAELSTWKTEADSAMLKNHEEMVKAQTKLFEVTQKLKGVATQRGIDPKEFGIDGDAVTIAPKARDAADFTEYDKRYLQADAASRLVSDVKLTPFIAAELEDIVDEHKQLFGGKGLNRKALIESATKNKRTLRDEWEAANEVGKRRSELQEKSIEERINARVNEEKTKILSEHKLPVTRGGDGAPPTILSMRGDLGLAESRKDTTSAVDAAVSAYNAGKYRTSALPTAQK